MNGRSKMEKQKLNNDGFSLIEVLVAVIILAVVSVPLIRSFGSVAVTNSDSHKLMLATDCAENMMEISKDHTMEELVAMYGTGANTVVLDNATGVYTFTLTEGLPSVLPRGHQLKMTFDPTKFSNNNAYNISDVRSMSMLDTAVYEMSPLYDSTVYNTFYRWNQDARAGNAAAYRDAMGPDYFKDKLTRHIEVTIEKTGTTGTDEDGNTVEHITVNLDIRYDFASLASWQQYLPNTQHEYIEDTKELFNNTTTNEPLTGIYLFFDPCFEATEMGNEDEIIIHNPDNVVVDVFLSSQSDTADMTAHNMYFSEHTGPVVTVEETRSNTTDPAAITLFTNLSSDAPYSSKAVADGTIADGKILCQLSLKDSAGNLVDITGQNALKLLDGRDLDGKALLAGNTKKRIYKVTTQVIETANSKEIVELDGTKLE